MNIHKVPLKKIDRCYAAGFTTVDGEPRYLFATEDQGRCWQFRAGDFAAAPVWFGPGGAMSLVAIPGRNGDFLAIQNFFPIFDSKHATIAWCSPAPDDRWNVKTILNLPYVHRFDILSGGGAGYFLGCTLCTSKSSPDDWSDPGKLWAGRLPDGPDEELRVEPICEGLLHNHGYCRTEVDGVECGCVTSDAGIHLVFPPERAGGGWRVEKFSDAPTSDIAFCDIDGDGEREWIAIEPFHGGNIAIYKRVGGEAKPVWRYEGPMEFGHALWGGKLRGRPAFLFGYRRLASELVLVECAGTNPLVFKTTVIERDGGPANVSVSNEADRDVIVVANNSIGEAAIFIVTD